MMTSKISKSLSKNLEESFVMPNDVKKVGYMKKLKTMKKKYFVLRDNSDVNEASLSYYDSEKKFKSGISQPKRSIYLKHCFSINRKIDAKHKYAIALYTKDDCFATVVDNEIQLKEWLETMIDLQSQSIESGQNLHYEHVWQVYINRNGLGQTRNMTGIHRLCLTDSTLYIVKVDPQTDFPDVYEFPLISIRRCGHTSSTFFIELGRSSSIGPGELWIQAEDSAIAQNMHEVILSAMKSSKNHEEFGPSQRPRSASTSDKPISTRRPQTSLANQNMPLFGAAVPTYSSSTSSSVSTSSATISSIRERCDSMPSRSRTSSETESTHDSRLWTSAHYHTSDRLHSGLYSRTLSYSPPSQNPLSPSSGACSTDSAGSSYEDFESTYSSLLPMTDHHSGLHNSLIPSEPPISEEDTQIDDYLSMEPNTSSSTSHQIRSQLNLSFRSTNTVNMSPLTSPTFSSVKSMSQSIKEEINPYMPMSPVGSIETESLSSSRRSSGLDRNLIPDVMSSDYMTMKSSQDIESTTSEEYLNMAPMSASLPRTDSLSSQKSLIKEEYHLEKVKSYFSPTEETDSLDYMKPVRAYSIGSRPQLKTNTISSLMKIDSKSKQLLPKSGAQTPENEDETRIRAFSMGSHSNAREARVAAKKKALIEGQIGGPNLPIEEVTKSSKKASSAPVLSPVVQRKRSATVGSRPLFNRLTVNDRSDTDLMEIDYSKSMQSKSWKEKLNEERVKRSSVVHRQRSNSRSSTSSSGIGSASTTSPSITSSMNELNDKRKDQSANIVVSLTNKSGDEMIQSTCNRAISKEIPNEYLQVVIMNPNQETKLPLRPITNQVSQLSTVPSIHSVVQQSHTKTLPINKSEKIAQKFHDKPKQKTKISDDSGDYVCLDMSSTNYVPESSESTAAIIVAENVPKIATNSPSTPTSTTKTHPINEKIESVFVPKYENIEINCEIDNKNNNNEVLAKSRPTSCFLPEIKKQRSVPNADTSVINFRQTSCPSNLDRQFSLSPLLSSKRSMTNNQLIGQTLSKSSPDRNCISNELAPIESRSFKVIGPQNESSYENVSLGSGSLSSSRPSSVSSEREINYASLDLAHSSNSSKGENNSSETSDELKTLSPRLLKSPNQLSLHSNVVSSSSCATPIPSFITCCGSQELLYSSADSSSLSYAEIDFKKSEGLRNTASSGRN